MSIWEILNNKWSHLGKIKKIVEILEKIRYHNPMKLEKILINRKHEMFWNKGIFEMIHKAFMFGFGQGIKCQKKRGKVNKNRK